MSTATPAMKLGNREALNVALDRIPSAAEVRTGAAFKNGYPVQYEDGEVSIIGLGEGYHVTLNGRDNPAVKSYPSPSYATGFSVDSGARIAILSTRNRGIYAIGRGVVYGLRSAGDKPRIASLDPGEEINLTIGDNCKLPGLPSTHAIQSVHFRLEMATPGTGGSFGFGAQQLERISPFPAIDSLLIRGRDYLASPQSLLRIGKAALV